MSRTDSEPASSIHVRFGHLFYKTQANNAWVELPSQMSRQTKLDKSVRDIYFDAGTIRFAQTGADLTPLEKFTWVVEFPAAQYDEVHAQDFRVAGYDVCCLSIPSV